MKVANSKFVHISFIKRILYFLFDRIPDKSYLSLRFRLSHGKRLRLNPPVTYSEKLQWLKLYDRNPKYTDLVDKYEMKKMVSSVIGEEYVIETLGVFNSFEEIDFAKLPNQFVLKCTHDSGSVAICKDKKTFDFKNASNVLSAGLKRNWFYGGREWAYKNVEPRIIAERYVEDSSDKELRDYKFFCFRDSSDSLLKPKMLFIATDREDKAKDTCFDFFDMDFNHIDIRNGHPNAMIPPHKPDSFEEMKALCVSIGKGLLNKYEINVPQLRIDFYVADGRTYVGELTMFHHSGFMPFEPEEWDEKMGEWLMIDNTSGIHRIRGGVNRKAVSLPASYEAA